MLIRSTFRSELNQREILPVSAAELSFICMYTDLNDYFEKSFPWHWHDVFEIDYIARGSVECKTPDQTVLLHPGEAVFFNTGIMHAYRAADDSGCQIYAYLFDAQFLTGMYHHVLEQKYLLPITKCANLQMYPIRTDSKRSDRMLDHIRNVIEQANTEPFGYEFEIRSELSRFWCLLLESTEALRRDSPALPAPDTERVKQMIGCIHEHYPEKLTLKDIAAAASISTRECTRCFRTAIRTSPISYLNDYRIRIAAQMLMQTDDSIITISENCGFSSVSYFGKVFHAAIGCTPAQYRKEPT